MEKIIALLKFYKTILDFAHWNNKGYADHLLYDRIRNEVDDVLDSVVEKYLAFNQEVKYTDFLGYTKHLQDVYSGFTKEDLLEFAQYLYDEIEDKDIQDMVKVHIYLLKK